MIEQLVWVEILIKGTAGVLLLAAPLLLARLLGLPRTESGFWPRIAGALLLGLAGAYLVEGLLDGRARGMGIAGSVVLNLASVLALVALLTLGGEALPWRGRATLLVIIVGLTVLALVEIAYAQPVALRPAG